MAGITGPIMRKVITATELAMHGLDSWPTLGLAQVSIGRVLNDGGSSGFNWGDQIETVGDYFNRRRNEMETEVAVPVKTETAHITGQHILKAGFKETSEHELEKYFACDAVTRSFNERAEKRAYDKLRKRHPGKFIKIHPFRPDSMSRGTLILVYEKQEDVGSHSEIDRIDIEPLRCEVKCEAIDEYMRSEIPGSCLEKVEEAKKLGINDFTVAYPVMKKLPRRDPVVIGRFHKKWIWIDMWE